LTNGPTVYRKIFCDIVRGYSRASYKDNDVYIKHLTTHDQVDLEDIEESFLEKARKRGVPTEEETLKSLRKDGTWTTEDDAFIEQQEVFIENLTNGKKQLMLKSQLDKQDEQIKEAQTKLLEKISIKHDLLGSTCEKYAKQRVNDHYIIKSFFQDEQMKNVLYSSKEFDEVAYSDLSHLISIHNIQFTVFTEENIQKLILEDFFYPYMPFSEDTMQFFGQPVCQLTHNQLKLILFVRLFKSIFENNEDIPSHIKKDPKALLDFASSSQKGKEVLDKHEDKGGATTIVGATKEDYEYMGVNKASQVKGESLTEAAKKKGGTLNMQDLMDLTGA
jgi:hypothetical protein